MPAAVTGGMPRWIRHIGRVTLHLTFDACAVALAFYAAYRLRFHWSWLTDRIAVPGSDPGWGLFAQLLRGVLPLWLGVFWYACGLYTRQWPVFLDRVLQIFKGTLLGTLATLALTFIFARITYSRLVILAAAPFAAVFVSAAHALVLRLDSLMAEFEAVSPMLVIGQGKVVEVLRENIHSRHPRVPIVELEEVPAPEALMALVREKGIVEVVLGRSAVDHAVLLELAEACENSGLNFRMIPDLLELRLGELQMDESLGLPAYRLQHTQLTRANFFAKRAFDLIFSGLVLLLLGPFLLLVALLIRLDSKGPALFKQKRIGFRGEPFDAFKFRTMVVGAESKLQEAKKDNDQGGGFFKSKADPRVTAVGRWLRRYSIDEFPQFLNVLTGEMSVVGPRPLAVTTGEMDELVRLFGRTAKKRTNILPGITGLWQVSGRSDISAEQRFSLDMFYIEQWSLGMDLGIILRTVPAMLSGKGAY